MAAAARAAPKPPFTVLLAPPRSGVPFETDALAVKPTDIEEAKRLVNGAIRIRQPSRVLVVDDSSTMRSIVRKTLAATRFPLDVTEAAQGLERSSSLAPPRSTSSWSITTCPISTAWKP